MKEFYNDRLTRAIYNNYNNKRNKIFSGLCYEYDYEFANDFDKEKNEELPFSSIEREHKRDFLKKQKVNSNQESTK